MRTIAIDFDGVIHKYEQGYKNGEIYDDPVPGAIEHINKLIEIGKQVFIFSTRSPYQIKKWLKKYSNPLLYMSKDDYMDIYHPFQYPSDEFIIAERNRKNLLQYKCEVIPFWKKFHDKKGVLGITRRKLVAGVYIDDRAITFNGDWEDTIRKAIVFKSYQEPLAE